MRFSGSADLPLHGGHVPPWLIKRMKNLAAAILTVIVEDYGRREVLRRLSDPYWFQSFGCVLGFDWHSSGLTTVVTGVLRESVKFERQGIAVAGGKGKLGKSIPERLEALKIDEDLAARLIRASRLTAKVDNSVLQDGYSIYHHALIFTEDGEWAVIQQGMNEKSGYARRYHWLWEDLKSFVVEPHSGLAGDRVEERVLNLVSRESEEVRRISVDLVSENPAKLVRMLNLASARQETLSAWTESEVGEIPPHLALPRKINWKIVKRIYDIKPSNYEELVEIRGVGAATLRALALISALIYGVKIDWRDPLKFSFAVGGKDGVPYPVSRKRMDRVTGFLREVLEEAEIGREEKKNALKRLLKLERQLYTTP